MDNFMDQIAQKYNAGDIIGINAAAQEKDLETLRAQVAEYDARLSELRTLNLKNLELTGQIQDYVKKSEDKLSAYEALVKDVEEKAAQGGVSAEDMEKLQAAFAQLNKDSKEEIADLIHKEGVKVYKNVQALVEEDNRKTLDAIENKKFKKGGIIFLLILGLLMSAGSLAMQLLTYFHIL